MADKKTPKIVKISTNAPINLKIFPFWKIKKIFAKIENRRKILVVLNSLAVL